ncbi:hypothetical protein AMATHDRAFT_2741 [Amanita thiersii Skay4041]|uniref:DNA polymerase delta subunit 3 n=1 Tax=Amanita thiersii Skay4041 TaxID=703135 RepID=A0A2A9NNZ9_9AGAR|nr:hypothetical protein AMATHDRAFT_2741 [Amanita thiersii Skay4041]
MSNQQITDFLTKQLFVERNIVTYRLLSREFGLHVNQAKNELATFHKKAPFLSHPVECHASYLVTGETNVASRTTHSQPQQADDDDNPYVDYEEDKTKEILDTEFADAELATQVQWALTNEPQLEVVKARYSRLYNVHVYCLSPSILQEHGIMNSVTEKVRAVDNKKDMKAAASVGRIIDPRIQVGMSIQKYIPIPDFISFIQVKPSNQPVAGPSKERQYPPKKVETTKAKEPIKQTQKIKEEVAPVDKPEEKAKASGKAGFFKAKETKESTEKSEKAKAKKQTDSKMFFSAAKSELEKETDNHTRGTKRKSMAQSAKFDSEDGADTDIRASVPYESLSTTIPEGRREKEARVVGSIVMSDDEEGPRMQLRRNRRIRKVASDVDMAGESAVRDMMDIDDEHVTRASRPSANNIDEDTRMQNVNTSNGAVEGDVKMEMEDEEVVPKAKPKARKPRKVVPVGRNGLKKKRVVKSRMTLDEKGYTVTVDYSSYESIDEDESEEVQTKLKRKTTTVVPENEEKGDNNRDETGAAPLGRAGSRSKLGGGAKGSKMAQKAVKGGQAKIMAFFGAPKGRK